MIRCAATKFLTAALPLLASLPATAASPGATWGELSGERVSKSSLNRAATTLKTVDGAAVLDRRPKVRPGMHTVVVHAAPRGGVKSSDRTLRIDVKSCKRYYVNAQFVSSGSSLWQAVIDKVEDIPGCGAAGAAPPEPGGASAEPGKAPPRRSAPSP